jgi:hypothetical protein
MYNCGWGDDGGRSSGREGGRELRRHQYGCWMMISVWAQLLAEVGGMWSRRDVCGRNSSSSHGVGARRTERRARALGRNTGAAAESRRLGGSLEQSRAARVEQRE